MLQKKLQNILLIIIIIQLVRFLYYYILIQRNKKTNVCSLKELTYRHKSDEDEESKKDGRILLIGDRIVTSPGVKCNLTIGQMIGNIFNRDVDVIGRDNATTSDVLDWVQRVNGNYKAIIVIVGSNDITGFGSLLNSHKNLIGIYEKLHQHTDNLFMTGSGKLWNDSIFVFPLDWYVYFRAKKFREIYQLLDKMFSDFTFIDMFEPYDRSCYGHMRSKCLIDGTNFNMEGNRAWANNLAYYLELYARLHV